ncbi:TPA: hypothetical protein RUX44_003057 [Aeromonas hydrophila]|uniref:toxin VasX n=1 Tax=Aeromonas hydrophila TaxID=644 RepID=UPI0028D92047|nr:hypothetical protein [Aeromonas hydrophila]
MGQQNQAKGGPNQAAMAASHKDCKSPVGTCPFKHSEIALVPVRYALDEEFEAPATQPHPLPAKDFKGPLSLKANPYTLRQLRDGWLYVFDETAKELDEYEVRGSQFIHASKGSKGHLLYPANHKVAMAFSHQRWTERLKKEYCEQNSLRSKGMRSFNLLSLASKMGGEHAGLLDLLSTHVADMGLPNEGFVDSCAPLKAPEGVEPGLLWRDKPAGSANACKVGIPDLQSALVVALDDFISDMHDMTIRQSAVWAKLESPFSDDTLRHQWTMAAITEMVGLPPVNEQQLPADIKGNRLATFRFKKSLLAYACAERERQQFMSAPPVAVSTPQMAESLTARADKALKALQGYKPDPELVRNWGEYRYQDVVRWQALEAHIAQYQPLQDSLRQQWVSTCDDALAGLAALPANPLLLGIDSQTPAGQTYLITCQLEWLSTAQMMSADKKQAAALQKTLQKDALPALAYYGFDAEVKEELVAQAPWLNISNTTAGANASAGWSALADEGRVLDSKFFAGLGASAKATMDALHQAITGPAMQAWERLTMVLHPLLLKGQSSAAWVAAAALEAVHTGQAVRFNKEFKTEANAWLQHQREAAGMQSRQLGTPGKLITPHQTQELGQAGQQLQRARWPRLLLLEGRQAEFEANVARYQSLLRQGGVTAASQAGKVWDSWGNFGGLAALVNMTNLVSTQQHYQENRLKVTGNPKALADLDRAVTYTAAWTGSAIAGVYQGSAYGALKENTLLAMKLKDVAKEGYGALARRFALSMGAMAGLGLVAASLEFAETWGKTEDPTNSDTEQFAYYLKALGIVAQGFAAAGALIQLGLGAAIGVIWAPWMMAFIAIGGVAYLLSTWLLARFGRTPIERWLLQSTWGTKPAGWTPAVELEEYERLAHAPDVTIDEKGGELLIRMPAHISDITLQAGVQRIGYQANPSGSYPAVVPVYGPPQALPLPTRQGQRGEYRLPHTLTQGDKLILLITYPAQESLSGTAQRFVIRGSLALGAVLTAETDATLPVKGILIEMKQ